MILAHKALQGQLWIIIGKDVAEGNVVMNQVEHRPIMKTLHAVEKVENSLKYEVDSDEPTHQYTLNPTLYPACKMIEYGGGGNCLWLKKGQVHSLSAETLVL